MYNDVEIIEQIVHEREEMNADELRRAHNRSLSSNNKKSVNLIKILNKIEVSKEQQTKKTALMKFSF